MTFAAKADRLISTIREQEKEMASVEGDACSIKGKKMYRLKSARLPG